MQGYLSLLAGLSLGFLGSTHCIGMCGPLAVALPLRQTSGLYRFSLLLFYHIARVMVYTLFGWVLGAAGERFLLFGWQQGLSVVLGVLLLVSVFGVWFWQKKKPATHFFSAKIAAVYRRFFSDGPGYKTFLILGFLNGLLPCGLVYVAWGLSASSTSSLYGALLMAGFGLGTIPALFSLSYFSGWIRPSWRRGIQKLSPVVISLTAVLLILRGLNLGIPYISPQYNQQKKEIHSCCHKPKACH